MIAGSSAPRSAGLAVPRMDVCGHSIPGAGGATGGDQNAYPDRLAKALGVRKRANIAQGGSIACWPTANASGDGGHSWVLNNFYPPTSGDGNGGYQPNTTIAVVHNVQNDLAAIGAANFKPALEAMQTIASRYCAAALYPDVDPSWTWGTAMSTVTGSSSYSGGSGHYAQWGGALNAQQFGQWACPADYPGNEVIAIGMSIVPAAVGIGGTTTVTLTVDGTAYNVVFNHDKGGHADAENGKNNEIVLRFGRADCGLGRAGNQYGVQIPVLAAGAHTVKVALTSSNVTGAYFIINYAQIEADPLDGPLIVVPNCYRAASPTNGGYNLWTTGWAHGPTAATDPLNDASVASANAQIQSVLANEFPGRTVYVDIDSVLQKNAAYLSPTDYTHPTNRGHAMIAAAIYRAIVASGLITPRLLAATQNGRLGQAYDGGVWRPIGGAYGTSIGVPFANTWVSYGSQTNVPQPAYLKDLTGGRIKIRGWVKQNGAGAANSVITTFGAGYVPQYIEDRPCVTYSGTVWGLACVRVDAGGALYMLFSGQVAAGSINNIENEYAIEAGA